MKLSDKNEENIQTFLQWAPVIGLEFEFDVDTGMPQIASEHIHYSEPPRQQLSHTSSGVNINIDAPDYFEPDVIEGIKGFIFHCGIDALGKNITSDSLMAPIKNIGHFFEALKVTDIIRDYDVFFDLDKSSFRSRTIAYGISVMGISQESQGFSIRDVIAQTWDYFLYIVTHPRSAELIVRLPEYIAKLIQSLN